MNGPSSRPERITMLLENNPYPQDVRVRAEAESLHRAGHDVTVIAPRGRGEAAHEWVRGVEVRRFWLPAARPPGAAGFVFEYLVAGVLLHLAALRALVRGATVLHIHNPPDILFGAGAMFRLMGRKVIFDHHDLFPETIEVKFGGGPAVPAARAAQRLTFAVANHVIATNASYAEVALRNGKAPGEVTIVRNAPPSDWTHVPVVAREGKLEHLELAYAGAIAVQDGVEGLAPVLAELDGMLDVRLTIVGDGDARPTLERAFAERGVGEHVAWTGWVAGERVPELLAQADICVDPSPATDVNNRSTMIKIAEYLALGKPVVAYRLLETERTAGDAACLVDPGDAGAFAQAIVRLAHDPAARTELAARARQRAAELTWEHSERALLSAYAALRTERAG